MREILAIILFLSFKRRTILVDLHGLFTIEPSFHVLGQLFRSGITIRKQGIAAPARQFHRIKHGRLRWIFKIGRISVECHLAVRKRADWLAILANIGNQHDMLTIFIDLVWLLTRTIAAAKLAKMQRKDFLLFQRNVLIPQQDNGVVMKRFFNQIECICG